MKKIAILGASEPHLPLYLKAREMGLEIHGFAWAEGAYCRDYADCFHEISIADKERIVEVCRHTGIDGIVSNALEVAVPTAAYVARELHLNGISCEAAARARNKRLMRDAVAVAGACMQPDRHLYTPGEVPAKYPVIVKPTDGSCSNGVTKAETPKEFAAAVERALGASGNGEILIEEFIGGREISVETISFHGKHYVLTITDKETTGAPYFVETAHHQPSDLPEQVQLAVRESVCRVLDALDIGEGASHAEFKIDADGNPYFIEVGARGGGDFISYDLVELSTGYDFVKGMIEVALGEFTPPVLSGHRASGVYFLGLDTAQIRAKIVRHKDDAWVRRWEIEDTPLKRLTKSQDRTGYIIYQADRRIILD